MNYDQYNEAYLEHSKKFPDAVTVNTEVRFDLRDRLRLLFHGRLSIRATVFYKARLPEEGPSMSEVYVQPLRFWPRPKVGFVAAPREKPDASR